MPLEKLADPPKLCRHPDHELPDHRQLEPGTWRHVCAGCGKETKFTVPERHFQYPIRPNAGAALEGRYCELETVLDGKRVACARAPGHAGDCDFLRGLE